MCTNRASQGGWYWKRINNQRTAHTSTQGGREHRLVVLWGKSDPDPVRTWILTWIQPKGNTKIKCWLLLNKEPTKSWKRAEGGVAAEAHPRASFTCGQSGAESGLNLKDLRSGGELAGFICLSQESWHHWIYMRDFIFCSIDYMYFSPISHEDKASSLVFLLKPCTESLLC